MVLDRSHLKALSSLKTTVRARFISVWGRGWHLNFWAGLTHQNPSTRYDNLRCLEGVTIIAKFSCLVTKPKIFNSHFTSLKKIK
jgi:hypothetical protein